MKQAFTSYYVTELTDWSRTLEYCKAEIPEFEARLVELIHRNTIPNLALNAEHFLNQFKTMLSKLNSLLKRIHSQQHQIQQDQEHIDDQGLLTLTNNQDKLRNTMRATEKNFIELKYSCYNFFSSLGQ